MSLANLLKIGRLKAHAPNGAEIRRLLAAAQRNINDAGAETVSDETRFDAAYKAKRGSKRRAEHRRRMRRLLENGDAEFSIVRTLDELLCVGRRCGA